MAQFCTKCGTPMGEGMTFCTNCGATAAAPAARAAQPPAAATPAPPTTPSPGVAPAAAAPAPVAAAAKSGSPVLKIILAVLAVLIFFSLLIVGGCVYFIYRAKQKVNEFKKEAHITFPTEAGTREVCTEPGAKPTTEAVNMDVPIYPGATPTEAGGDMSMGAGVVKVQQYVTDDAVDKVVSFYKDKLGSSLTVQQSEGKAVLQLVGSAGLTNITVFRDDSAGKTKFSITRIGK